MLSARRSRWRLRRRGSRPRTARGRYLPVSAAVITAPEMSVPRISTGAAPGAKVLIASSASVYASSPVAQPALHARMVPVPAERATRCRARQSIVSSWGMSLAKLVSWIRTSSISRSTRPGP